MVPAILLYGSQMIDLVLDGKFILRPGVFEKNVLLDAARHDDVLQIDVREGVFIARFLCQVRQSRLAFVLVFREFGLHKDDGALGDTLKSPGDKIAVGLDLDHIVLLGMLGQTDV